METYRQYARENGYRYVFILKDNEDGEVYPVYFRTAAQRDGFEQCMLSEMKTSLIQLLIVE